MDLLGRPSGDADALRVASQAWEHLAWELWQLSRAVETKADALAQGWSGAAGDAYADVWRQVRRGFYDLDGRIHDVAARLRRAADAIEGGQAAYDRALAAAGIATVAGIGLTVFTLGLSDAAAAEADGVIAATAATIIADLEVTLTRVAALFAESAKALGGLAARFALNFAIRAPEFVSGPVGGGAIGASMALASGARDPVDIAASGLLGVADGVGGGRRMAGTVSAEEIASESTAAEEAVSAGPWRLAGRGDPLTKAAERVPSTPGFHDVVVHGTPTGFAVLRDGNWVTLDHRSIATFLKSNGYQGGPIRLISCGTGRLDTGAAQNLANKLGTEVMAPTDTLWILPDGRMTSALSPVRTWDRGGTSALERNRDPA